jgi:hypothetical protein
MGHFTNFFPKTKIFVGIRHPVLWFQSMVRLFWWSSIGAGLRLVLLNDKNIRPHVCLWRLIVGVPVFRVVERQRLSSLGDWRAHLILNLTLIVIIICAFLCLFAV